MKKRRGDRMSGRYKKWINIILLVAVMSITMVGCTKKENKEPTTAKTDMIDKKTGKIPLSKLIDWKQEKVAVSFSDYALSLVENDDYVFYVTTNNKIMRRDRRNGEKKTIVKLKKTGDSEASEGIYAGLTLFGEKLYYIVDNNLYQCDLNGKYQEKVVSGEEIITTGIEVFEDYQLYIDGVYIYKNDIYIYIFFRQEISYSLIQ